MESAHTPEANGMLNGEPIPDELIESAPVNRFDVSGQRYYSPIVPDDVPWEKRDFAPSVTTILQIINKPFLNKWARDKFINDEQYHIFMNSASFIGTLSHQFISGLVMGNTIRIEGEYPDDNGTMIDISQPKYRRPLQGYMTAFQKWWRSLNNPVLLGTEISLWDEAFAGTLDLLVEITHNRRRKIALVDVKDKIGKEVSGDHAGAFDHTLQLNGYAELCRKAKEAGEKIPFPDLLYNIYLGERGGFTLKLREFCPDKFYTVLDVWKMIYPDPPKEKIEWPIEFSLKETEDA